MNPQMLLCLALVLSGSLTGCSTARQCPVIAPDPDAAKIELPLKFAGYRELYGFMAKREGVQSYADAVFKLAADSETRILALDTPPTYVWVILPHFYNGGIYDLIRGAQGNGGIYLVHPLANNFTAANTDGGFELVGIAGGNRYEFSSVNQVPRLIAHWHLSAGEQPETVYEWNGKFFAQIKPDRSVSSP